MHGSSHKHILTPRALISTSLQGYFSVFFSMYVPIFKKRKNIFQIRGTDIFRNLNLKITRYFQSLEVLDRGSETQLQVDEKLI